MTETKGSAKAGPSNAYLRLPSGKITSKQYADQVKRSAKAGRLVQIVEKQS